MIIDPNHMITSLLPQYGFNDLKKLVMETDEEIYSLRQELKRIRSKVGPPVISDFLRDSLIINSDLLISSTQLKPRHLNSMNILFRTFLEIKIDFLWLYSHYLEDEKIGEILAKRYYQIGRNRFLEQSHIFKNIAQNDPYLKDIKDLYDIDDDISTAKSEQFIELVDKTEEDKGVKSLQRRDWYLVPGKYRKTIDFKERAKVATKLASKLFNLKNAPYYENWKILNQFTHPSAMQYKVIDDDVLAGRIHCRNLHVFLCFLHDMINVLCDYMKMPPNLKIREIRTSFNYVNISVKQI